MRLHMAKLPGESMTPEQEAMRQEREAIMLPEGATPEEITECFRSRPDLYGIEEQKLQQDLLFQPVRNYVG